MTDVITTTEELVAGQNADAATSTAPVFTGESSEDVASTSTPAAVSDEAQTPSGADSTESNGNPAGESVGDVSAEQSIASEAASDDSPSLDLSNGAETSPVSEVATNEPEHTGSLIPGVGQPDHVGFVAKLHELAARLEIEVLEDVVALEQKLADHSVATLEEITEIKAAHNIA